MTGFYQRLRDALPSATFYPPATPAEIQKVERALKTKLPDWLRELYLDCNGIHNLHGDPYLYSLDVNPRFSDSLLSWNEFWRAEWAGDVAAKMANRPEVDWQGHDPHKLIFIGRVHTTDWAIRPRSGPEIIEHVSPDGPGNWWNVIAQDLIEACVENDAAEAELENELFSGRAHYKVPSDAARDIDRVFNEMLSRWRAKLGISTGQVGKSLRLPWHIDRATTRSSGDLGELFIITSSGEVRLASRDGYLPFVMRLKIWTREDELSCVTWTVDETVTRILVAQRELNPRWVDQNVRPRPDEPKLRALWRSSAKQDPELSRLAEVLFARDDARKRTDPASARREAVEEELRSFDLMADAAPMPDEVRALLNRIAGPSAPRNR